jgi:hypothetical protein
MGPHLTYLNKTIKASRLDEKFQVSIGIKRGMRKPPLDGLPKRGFSWVMSASHPCKRTQLPKIRLLRQQRW